MKKIIVVLSLMLAIFIAIQSNAEEVAQPKEEDISLWDIIRKKIETLTPKKKLVATSAVGGVRGTQLESDDLYWKGESVNKELDAKELGDFKNALRLYELGNTKGANKAFSLFIRDYPESQLVEDANKALELLAQSEK